MQENEHKMDKQAAQTEKPHASSGTTKGTKSSKQPTAKSTELIIEGASCASCVSKIETSLKALDGVTDANMNFAQRTVLVEGNVDEKLLIQTIEKAGYNAKGRSDASDDQLLEEKEQADLVYYKKLMRNMWVALGLGVP
ncbi:cation transporter, partial [Paraglaciecola sp.]|uniref:cation transporter n=1 Tax=Paraglaciecola sp. TaxID=1920173 RepID=UPI0030F496AF